MGNDPNKHINALGILDFFNKALIPAKLKFKSSSLGKKCPIYFNGIDDTTIVLPPVNHDRKKKSKNNNLAVMIDSILSVEGFNLEQIKGKNIVIPIAYNRKPPNDYFVTLFYDAENKQLTIYDPLDNANLSESEVDSYSNILKTKLNLDINKTVKTKLNLSNQPDKLDFYGFLTTRLTVVLSNSKDNVSKNVSENVQTMMRIASEDIQKLQSYSLNSLSHETKKNAIESFYNVLRRIQSNPETLKELLKTRGGISVDGNDITHLTSDEIVKGIADNKIQVNNPGRFLAEEIYIGLQEGLSLSQRVVLDAVMMEVILGFNNEAISEELQKQLNRNDSLNDFIELDNMYPQYYFYLGNLFKNKLYTYLVPEINKVLQDNPDLFIENTHIEILEEENTHVDYQEKETHTDSQEENTHSDSLAFTIFKAVVKTMFFLAILALMFVAVVVMLHFLGTDITAGLGLGASVGAGSIYGAHSLFKSNPTPSSFGATTDNNTSNEKREDNDDFSPENPDDLDDPTNPSSLKS